MRNAWMVAATLLVATAAPALAQRHEATLEGSVIRGALGYAREVGPGTLLGAEIGFGFPQIDRTLTPARDATTGEPHFEEFLHAAAFIRLKRNDRFELDTGLRGSIADLWPCGASDCWPAPFAGAYVQPMVGGRNVKVGARLVAGWIAESRAGSAQSSTFTAGLTPLIVRATLPW